MANVKPDIAVTSFVRNNGFIAKQEENESYFQLVWRRFRRSTVSIVGTFMVLILVMLAIFADFFCPTSLYQIDLPKSFIPPQRVHFIDHEGKLHLRPFVYNSVYTLDPKTFKVYWAEDDSKAYEIKFFVQGSKYKLLGQIPTRLHLYGVEEGLPVA